VTLGKGGVRGGRYYHLRAKEAAVGVAERYGHVHAKQLKRSDPKYGTGGDRGRMSKSSIKRIFYATTFAGKETTLQLLGRRIPKAFGQLLNIVEKQRNRGTDCFGEGEILSLQ